jgi:hypothetical protein
MRCPPIDGSVNHLFGVNRWVGHIQRCWRKAHATGGRWRVSTRSSASSRRVGSSRRPQMTLRRRAEACVNAEPELPPLPAVLQRQETPEVPKPRGRSSFPTIGAISSSWLASSDDVPGSQWDARRVLPVGEAGAPLMLLTAWPEIDDQRDATLFCRPRRQVARRDAASDRNGAQRLLCRQPRCDASRGRPLRWRRAAAELDRLLWHHLRLAKPGRLLLIGGDIVRMAATRRCPIRAESYLILTKMAARWRL